MIEISHELKNLFRTPIKNDNILDIKPLKSQSQLMERQSYRRMVNIIQNHEFVSNNPFRNNLIKQLYFLLRIIPEIQSNFHQQLLLKIESWYNTNDYKKIGIMSQNLEKLIKCLTNPKERYQITPQRPKSSITWQKNLKQFFFRPNTAKNQLRQFQDKNARPISSKYGQKSTKADSLDQLKSLFLKDQIQSKMQEFQNNQRTRHTELQPPNEQLFYLYFKKLDQQKEKMNKPVKPLLLQKKKEILKRNITSPNNTKKFQSQMEQNEFMLEDEQYSEEDKSLEIEKENENKLNLAKLIKKKIYMNDIWNEQDGRRYDSLNTYKDFKDKQNDKNMFAKIDQIRKKKDCIASIVGKENKQIANEYLKQFKNKSIIKSQLSRKIQSSQLITQPCKSVTYLKKSIPINYSKIKTQVQEIKQKSPNTPKIYQFFHSQSSKLNQLPTYNKKNFFKKRKLGKLHIDNRTKSLEELPATVQKTLSTCPKIGSNLRYQTVCEENVENYNRQQLNQLQKIHNKYGSKEWCSLNNLKKAMIVDPYVQYPKKLQWQNRDKGWAMLLNQQKNKKLKKKKKGKKK